MLRASRASIFKQPKVFFNSIINTNTVEGFLLQQRWSNGCLKLPRYGLEKDSVLAKNGHFQGLRGRFKRCPNVLIFYIRSIGTNIVRLRRCENTSVAEARYQRIL
jgi:hypothetical protein